MDVYCPRCGEPWDTDEFHDVPGMSYDDAVSTFRSRGCAVFPGARCNPPIGAAERGRALASRAVLEESGNDLDAAAALMMDLGFTNG